MRSDMSLTGAFRGNPLLTVVVTGVVFGLVLNISRGWILQQLVDVFLVTVLAFLMSDLVSAFVIRGGRGIVQVPMIGGTRAQPRSWAFLVLFIVIPISGIVIDLVSREIWHYLYGLLPAVIIEDIVIGLFFALLVYTDLLAKYFAR